MQNTETMIFNPRWRAFFEKGSQALHENAEQYRNNFYKEHYNRSKEEISLAINGLKNTALILGAGGMNDLPVMQLAEQFDTIILADIDLTYTKLALRQIPRDLRSKFTLKQIDLTGQFSTFALAAESEARKGLPFEDFISNVLRLLPLFKEKGVRLEVKVSFVASSMLCSQLAGGIVIFLTELCDEFYGRSFDLTEEAQEEFVQNMFEIQRNHIEDLCLSVQNLGKVYFADHFSLQTVCCIKSNFEEREIAIDKSAMYLPGMEKVKMLLHSLFIVQTSAEWTWVVPTGTIPATLTVKEKSNSSTTQLDALELRKYTISAYTLTHKTTG